MVNYENGKIYKIIDNTNGNIYIGSTAEKYLSTRLAKHKNHYKRYLNKIDKTYYTSYEILKNNNFNIELIENYKCNDIYELKKKEAEYIKNIPCVNSQIPCRTKKEWNKNNEKKIKEWNKNYRETNNEYFKDYKKIYYNDNKTEILKKLNEKVKCEFCNCEINKSSLTRHKKKNKKCLIIQNN